MRKVFDHLAQIDLEEKTIMSLVRLIGIWHERQIFDKKTLHDIHKIWDHKRKTGGRLPPSDTISPKRKRVSSGGSTSAERRKSREIAEIEDMLDAPLEAAASVSAAEKTSRPEVETLTLSPRQGGSPGSGDPPEPEELIQALQDLENSASSDAVVREKIAKLPPEVSEVAKLEAVKTVAGAQTLLGQVDEASGILDTYNLRLQDELKDRKKVGNMMSEFLSAQKDLLAQAEERLELYLDKLEKIHQVKDELKSHIASLPDIPVVRVLLSRKIYHLIFLFFVFSSLHRRVWLLFPLLGICSLTDFYGKLKFSKLGESIITPRKNTTNKFNVVY